MFKIKKEFSLAKTIIRMTDVKENEARDLLWLFLIGSISLAWVSKSTYDILCAIGEQYLSDYLHLISLGFGNNEIIKSISGAIIPLLVFSWAAYKIHKKYAESNVVDESINTVSPFKHKGLVLLLSSVWDHNDYRNTYLDKDIKDENLPKIRKELFNSNWGPLLYAIEYHKEQLQHCWLICSGGKGGSIEKFDVTERLIKKFIPNCNVYPLAVDPFIISEKSISSIKSIYLNCVHYSLKREDIMFDFTGGTAAMTGSMILATIDDDLKLEYIRQDRKVSNLLNEKGGYKEDNNDSEYLQSIETKKSIIKG